MINATKKQAIENMNDKELLELRRELHALGEVKYKQLKRIRNNYKVFNGTERDLVDVRVAECSYRKIMELYDATIEVIQDRRAARGAIKK